MTNSAEDRARAAFVARYREQPRYLVSAPGRVNLIGDHTDYQDGFVMPVALRHRTSIALRPRGDTLVNLEATDLGRIRTLDIAALEHRPGDWSDYVSGVASALTAAGYALVGWDGTLAGDVPRGSGLSSSAALEVAATRAFAAAGGFGWDPVEMAVISQRAENEWVGMQCGIMDQLVSAAAVADSALLIDCRTLETTPVALPENVSIVVMDTSTRRGLVDSAYNERRAACERAAATLGVDSLRNASLELLAAHEQDLDGVTFRRARHVISENDRVLAAYRARSSPPELGALMDASHTSLRDDFEVSSPALDAMVDAARLAPGCYGARLTGAGFAGAAVALVEQEHSPVFIERCAARFRAATGLNPQLFSCRPGAGATLVEEVSA